MREVKESELQKAGGCWRGCRSRRASVVVLIRESSQGKGMRRAEPPPAMLHSVLKMHFGQEISRKKV